MHNIVTPRFSGVVSSPLHNNLVINAALMQSIKRRDTKKMPQKQCGNNDKTLYISGKKRLQGEDRNDAI
ncbi:hypothetical protein CBX96_04495 [Shewanella sp. BC20]|nr:hypothetical protein CBX96_04495 [Shewanella sp. BC20]